MSKEIKHSLINFKRSMTDECSRCDREIEGNCYFHSNPLPRVPDTKELIHVLDSMAMDAYHNYQLFAGYGSKHDMTAFAFVHPKTKTPLTRDEILKRHPYLDDSESFICDDCIDTMITYKEIVKVKEMNF